MKLVAWWLWVRFGAVLGLATALKLPAGDEPAPEKQAVSTTPNPLPYGGPPYVAPNPYVVWIDSGLTPTTTPPLISQCHGCNCVQLLAEGFAVAGQLPQRYGCLAASNVIPQLKWSGFDGEVGITFAVTVSDLDEPDGVGAIGNHVRARFWAANIPGDWRELSEAKVAEGGAVIGRNSLGKLALEPICPRRGRHRISVTLWVVKSSLPSLATDTPYQEVVEQLEAAELARATVYASAAAVPEALLQLRRR